MTTSGPGFPALALELGLVGPGVTCGIEGCVEAPAPYDRIEIATTEGFELCDVTLDGETQFLTDTPIPTVAFALGSQGIRLALGTRDGRLNSPRIPLPTGTRLGLKVRNISDEPRPFRAEFVVTPRPDAP